MFAHYFSVIIPMYNSENFIGNTIKSVLAQSFQNFEIVIINDGSTDNSEAVVRTFEDSRVKLINKTNGGVSSARNLGLKEARGKYIAFMDSDDYWYPNHLELASVFFKQNPEIKWYTSAYKVIPIGATLPSLQEKPQALHIFNYLTYAHQLVWTSSVIIETGLAKSVNGFPENCSYGEDTCFWYKIGIKEPSIGFSPQVTSLHLIRENSITQTLTRTNTYIYECIKAKRGKGIKNDRALQGMLASLLTYKLRRKAFKDFARLTKLIFPAIGLRLTLRTVIQVPYTLIFK